MSMTGLDGVAVAALLGGATSRACDPQALLRAVRIDPNVYDDPDAAIGGSQLFRLMRQVQATLDDSFLGFFAERFRLALERERTQTYLHCDTFGESIRVSIRSTQALSEDIGPQLIEDGVGLTHVCAYRTVPGVDRDKFVWLALSGYFSGSVG